MTPKWVHEIAAALDEYLQAASALPAEQVPSDPIEGWSAPAPGSHATGRSPWIYMTDIQVGAVGETVIVAFDWKPDARDRRSYLLPMTTTEADPTTGSDALLTRLDLFLDRPSWREHTHVIGKHTFLVVMPNH